ncbi:MAG: ABC transporter ATP-binding protein [Acidimicrobiia bacterium]|nr:ABC transporter ATP-binding protein [Acidimicrobiia bacterium]
MAVEAATLRYGDLTAVDSLTFHAEPASVLALLGPNGAGKTSTVGMLEGYTRPHSGAVRVLGLDPVADAHLLRPRVGLMLQTGGIYNGARASEVVDLFAAFYPDPCDPAGLLDRVGLGARARTPFRRLSGGEQRRLALAVALVGRPEVVFLDEPTAGMDPKARQLTYDLVRELRDDGVTVLLTTHLLDEAEVLADRVVIIDRGRLVAEGTPAELMAGGGIRFGIDPDRAAGSVEVEGSWPAALGVLDRLRPGHYLVHGDPTPEHLARIARWAADNDILLRYLTAGARSLEDVFLELVE